MITHYFTVQTLDPQRGADVWQIHYEGPVESRASDMFAKKTGWIDQLAAGVRPEFTVELRGRPIYRGLDQGAAKRAFYLRMRELSAPGRKTWTLAFLVTAQGVLGARYSVRPFEERLLGGDPQAGVSRTQFSDPP